MARVFRHGIVVLVAVLFSVQALAARQVIPEPGSVQRTWVPGSGPTAFVDSRDWNATVSTQSGARVEVPVTGKRSYGWPKWRAGAKSLIKGNAATALATAGIGALLAGVDWVMTEGILSKPNPMFPRNAITATLMTLVVLSTRRSALTFPVVQVH